MIVEEINTETKNTYTEKTVHERKTRENLVTLIMLVYCLVSLNYEKNDEV